MSLIYIYFYQQLKFRKGTYIPCLNLSLSLITRFCHTPLEQQFSLDWMPERGTKTDHSFIYNHLLNLSFPKETEELQTIQRYTNTQILDINVSECLPREIICKFINGSFKILSFFSFLLYSFPPLLLVNNIGERKHLKTEGDLSNVGNIKS